jgi:hypothetical protein
MKDKITYTMIDESGHVSVIFGVDHVLLFLRKIQVEHVALVRTRVRSGIGDDLKTTIVEQLERKLVLCFKNCRS